MAVNVTYSSTGQIGSIQRGTTSEKIEYDGQGRIVSRVFADGKTWSYTYLEKVKNTEVFKNAWDVLKICSTSLLHTKQKIGSRSTAQLF